MSVHGADVAKYAAIGLAAGCMSGLFGVGGGVVIVPLLLLVGHITQKRAQATSLAAIIVTAGAAAVPYALHNGVDWAAAVTIAMGGLSGSFVGTAIVRRLPDHWLKIAFAVVALGSAVQLALPHDSDGGHLATLSVAVVAAYLAAGLAMGILSALVGVGGGIVLVPILVFAMGLPQPVAQGLSLVVMVPVAAMGAIRGARAGHTDWTAAACVGVAGAIASPLAALAALQLPIAVLRLLFAALLVFTAAQIGWRGLKGLRATQ
jgi:uncharacterized membrane protein YfcA